MKLLTKKKEKTRLKKKKGKKKQTRFFKDKNYMFDGKSICVIRNLLACGERERERDKRRERERDLGIVCISVCMSASHEHVGLDVQFYVIIFCSLVKSMVSNEYLCT